MEGRSFASGVAGLRQGRRQELLARRRGQRHGHGGPGARSRQLPRTSMRARIKRIELFTV